VIKWQEEFKLYVQFKSTIILEGEILDKQPFMSDGDFELVPLDEYLHKELLNMGYKIIIYFNHVDGFSNRFDSEAVDNFKKIIKISKKGDKEEAITLTRESRDSKFGDATESIRRIMRNEVEPVAIILDGASRYITSSTGLQQDEQYFYSELFFASQNFEKPVVKGKSDRRLNNLMILVADKLNDIPPWFYLGNPYMRALQLVTPSYEIREKYYESCKDIFYGSNEINKKEEKTRSEVKRKFIDLTDGLRASDLDALREFMNREKIKIDSVDKALTLFKFGVKENPWSDPRLLDRLSGLEAEIRKSVKGQDASVRQVSDIITRAVYGLSGIQNSSTKMKPKGVMFFSGPTGTGKTELAKSLARWLFGKEEAFIRFDMSEYSQSHSDQRLLGAPPGYVGYESGGQLTNAVKEHPFSILLFDEIEKANSTILDKFLQILDDGRMTDGKGETVYFSDTVIIFTSNLGITKTNHVTGEKTERITYADCQQDNYNYNVFRDKILEGIDDFFIHDIGRPEIKNRIGDNFIVFEFIKKDVGHEIAESQLQKIIKNLELEKNIIMNISKDAKAYILAKVDEHLNQGGRGVNNAIEKYFVNPLARAMSAKKILSGNLLVSSIKDGELGSEMEVIQ
jgi:ATP-dependent Clp protease ATP-binding subunit ClpA